MEIQLKFGSPGNYDFDLILDQFSGTKINSFRTSSVPLLQFWKDTDSRMQELLTIIDLTVNKSQLCFEYPTKPKEGIGKSSMTDLMILCDETKIAIEAKFTEYAKMKPDPIKKWKVSVDDLNKGKVLGYWTKLISPFTNGFTIDSIQDISYQFYHRTASACKDSVKAIVIYQIFHDKETSGYLKKFKDQLEKYVKFLNPNEKLSFYIWEIEVEQIIKEDKINDPFTLMKYKNVYEIKGGKNGENDHLLSE